jgi:hypothetical protein
MENSHGFNIFTPRLITLKHIKYYIQPSDLILRMELTSHENKTDCPETFS